MRQLTICLLLAFFSDSSFSQVPVIDSLIPGSGSAGTAVTIKGNFFSADPASNIVHFGPVTANVIAANDSSLVAIVPNGATTNKLSVTVNNLITFSPGVFHITFDGDNSAFDVTSFGSPFYYSAFFPGALAVNDFDADGKPDFIYGEWMGGYSSKIVKNNSNSGNFVFDSVRVNLQVDSYSGASNVLADLDGDGKSDHLALQELYNDSTSRIAFRKNNSSSNINFGAKNLLTGRLFANSLLAVDADKDGKMDLAFIHYSSNTSVKYIGIYRNTSAADSISFAPVVEFNITAAATRLAAADLNGDHLDDMLVSMNDSTVSLLKNTSSPGNINFAQEVLLPVLSAGPLPAIADFDDDGRVDLCFKENNSKISIYKNTGGNGIFSFAPRQEITLQDASANFKITDINGDTKPDIILLNDQFSTSKGITLLKNTSNGGNISFATGANYKIKNDPNDVITGDFDGDGRPDILLTTLENGYNYGQLCLLHNNIGEFGFVELCPPAANTHFTASTGTVYQWQVKIDTGFANISDNANYNGTNQQTLQLLSLPTSFNGQQYRCITDGLPGKIFQLKFTNNWSGGGTYVTMGGTMSLWSNINNWSCGKLPDGNTDVVITSGPVYINTDAICRTLNVKPGIVVSTAPGVTLTITH